MFIPSYPVQYFCLVFRWLAGSSFQIYHISKITHSPSYHYTFKCNSTAYYVILFLINITLQLIEFLNLYKRYLSQTWTQNFYSCINGSICTKLSVQSIYLWFEFCKLMGQILIIIEVECNFYHSNLKIAMTNVLSFCNLPFLISLSFKFHNNFHK